LDAITHEKYNNAECNTDTVWVCRFNYGIMLDARVNILKLEHGWFPTTLINRAKASEPFTASSGALRTRNIRHDLASRPTLKGPG
jgi:hypothetical protein